VKNIICCMAVCLLLVVGCGRSINVAEDSLSRYVKVNDEVRTALFVKAWGLNRAAITESRQKLTKTAELALVESAQDGKVDASIARNVVSNLETELGKDEVVSSENFAYLSFLMVAGERADSLGGNVEFYLESQKPIWKQLSSEAKHGVDSIVAEFDAWGKIISSLKSLLPDTWTNTTTQTSN